MKKNYFYLLGIALVTMLSVIFVSCGKDKEEDKDDMIDTSPIRLAVGSEKIITGADTISSSNRFVAYGTKNTVKAYHVGETSLLVQKSGDTEIFIYPGYDFKVIDGLITNFHLPKSTLIMLVSALIGREFTLEVYKHAVEERYRFFSFGDSMFIYG